jgi:hypothetical protein
MFSAGKQEGETTAQVFSHQCDWVIMKDVDYFLDDVYDIGSEKAWHSFLDPFSTGP